MEQHPVPRNISGFQFRLIGDMTLRQFAYLAGGAMTAFVVYKITPIPNIFRYPLVGMIGLTGFALAFVPIQDRPLDKWLLAFIKSITSPTQYFWRKEEIAPDILLRPYESIRMSRPKEHIEDHADANNKLKAYLATIPLSSHQALNLKEKKYIDQTLSLFNEVGGSVPTPTATVLQSAPVSTTPHPIPPVRPTMSAIPPQSVSPTPTPPPHLQSPQKPIEPAPVASTPNPLTTPSLKVVSPPTISHEEFNTLRDQLSRLMEEKQSLAKELDKLKYQVSNMDNRVIVKPEMEEEMKAKPTIKSISAKVAVDRVGIPNLPETPNIVIGVIKDPQKRLMPNIIITIKDTKGLPLRAMKTNKLGQFATATPLANGTYLLEAEDPLKRFVFDIAQISLDGSIFMPIEITAKGQKEIMREQLSKELFGNPSSIVH